MLWFKSSSISILVLLLLLALLSQSASQGVVAADATAAAAAADGDSGIISTPAPASNDSNNNNNTMGDFLLDRPRGGKPTSAAAQAQAESNANNNQQQQPVPPPMSFASETFRSVTDGRASLAELRDMAIAQQELLERRAGKSAICPVGATADGLWGLNDPQFNALSFYHEAGKLNNTFGRWVAGPRERILGAICREQGDVSQCEWDKPNRWAPFRGGPLFNLTMSAAFYYRSHAKPRGKGYMTTQMIGGPQSSDFVHTETPPTLRNTRARAPPSHEAELNFCYDYQNPVKCLRGKTVVFLGDSHMLNLAQTLCRMVLKHYPERGAFVSKCGYFDVRFTSPLHVVFFEESNITIALLRVRYDLEIQMQKRFDNHIYAPFLEQTASFVVYNRAIWDLVYKDTDRKVVTAIMSQSLKYLAAKFKHARVIVKMLQYDHKFMRGCTDPDRMRQIRDANICATYIAMEDVAQTRMMKLRRVYRQLFAASSPLIMSGGNSNNNNNNSSSFSSVIVPSSNQEDGAKLSFAPTGIFDPYWKFSVLDSFGMTRELPYGKDTGATDSLGHHYEGAVIESLVQQLLSIMCPSQPQSYSLMSETFKRTAKTSCDRILHNTTSLRKPRCACNTRFAWRTTAESKEFCTLLRKFGNWVAYLVDG